MLATKDGKALYAHWKMQRPVKAVTMFRDGSDTLQIAHSLANRESTVLRWITLERCQRLNLPIPYDIKA